MSSLYKAIFHGTTGAGGSAIYIGKGLILGVDSSGGPYHGTYTEEGGRLIGQATLTAAGGLLVIGVAPPKGAKIPITFDLPPDLGAGSPVQVSVSGQKVTVSFEKIGDIP